MGVFAISPKYTSWLVLSDEQMSKGWLFSLLNDEQMSNWLGVEHRPASLRYPWDPILDFRIVPFCSAPR